MIPTRREETLNMKEFDDLVHLFEVLRAPGGCPWDAAQDHESIAGCAVEEAYELLDAIASGDAPHMREELGDLLLQVIFHSLIARDKGEFTLKDVIEGLSAKLVHRHPHVFGGAEASTPMEVARNWEALKKEEKGATATESILDGIPRSMCALMAARKMQSAASRVGFDWEDASGVIEKLREEIAELEDAISRQDRAGIKEEIGDLLFSVINCARLCSVDPEAALRSSMSKFRERFRLIEREAARRKKALDEMTIQEMDEIWEASKARRP